MPPSTGMVSNVYTPPVIYLSHHKSCGLLVARLCPRCQSRGSVSQCMQTSKPRNPTALWEKGLAGARSHSQPCFCILATATDAECP